MRRFIVYCGWAALRLCPWLKRILPDPFARERIARRYLSGQGIEIGALHNPLKIPPGARVQYVDRLPQEELRRQYPDFRPGQFARVDIIDDGETLASFPDGKLNFVIANHFLEHCQNPIGALANMLRVLRPDGVLFLAVPDMRHSFDKDRPVTAFAHVERDFREGPEWSRRPAVEEFVRLANRITDPEAVRREVESYLRANYAIHYHAWTEWEILEILLYLRRGLNLPLRFELACHRGWEVLFILRKLSAAPRESTSGALPTGHPP